MTEIPSFWSKLITHTFGPDTRIIFPRYFESKKNQVTLLEMQRPANSKNGMNNENDDKNNDEKPESDCFSVIAKYYVWGDQDREWETLNRAYEAGLPVPRALERVDRVSFFEFIPGKTLKVVSETTPETLDPTPSGAWLGHFHRTFAQPDGSILFKGDCMLPNFIIHRDTGVLYGIDFEESRTGSPFEEIADLAVTFLTTPASPENKKSAFERVQKFIDAYRSENPVTINPDDFKSLMETHLRKRIKFMPHRAREFEWYIKELEKTPEWQRL